MSKQITGPHHEAVYQELLDLVRKHAGHLSAIEILAVAANVVGKLIAMQDQTKTTTEQAMETVKRNIEIGNHQVYLELTKSVGLA